MQNLDDFNLWLPYTQMQTMLPPKTAVATKGVMITLEDGSKLVDGLCSWWTACHGYNNPYILTAVKEQLDVMPHVMLGGLVHPQVKILAKRLARLAPGDLQHVFFSESGSVAVEVALKIALQYWLNLGNQDKKKFVSFNNSYHGDTFQCMAVCDPMEGMHKIFGANLAQHYNVKLPKTSADFLNFGEFIAQHKQEIAAVIIEPLIQGAGGMQLNSATELQQIYSICKDNQILFIADEIFTGFGRTGTMFAVEKAGIVPDIMCLGKGLTGGVLPLAATIATEEIFRAFLSNDPDKALMHGPTYMGNALACSAANASLDLFEKEDRLGQVYSIQQHLQETLQDLAQLSNVVGVRILGAMAAIELKEIDINWFKRRFLELGVWLRPFGKIIYTTPAFTIQPAELQIITTAMNLAITEFEKKLL